MMMMKIMSDVVSFTILVSQSGRRAVVLCVTLSNTVMTAVKRRVYDGYGPL